MLSFDYLNVCLWLIYDKKLSYVYDNIHMLSKYTSKTENIVLCLHSFNYGYVSKCLLNKLHISWYGIYRSM